METQEFNGVIPLTDIIERIKNGKYKLLSCIVASLILATIYNYMAKPVYRASSIIAIEELSKDNILNIDIGNAIYKTNFIANRIQEIKTLSFAQKVYDALPDSIRGLFPLPDEQVEGFDKEKYIVQTINESVFAIVSEDASNMIVVSFESENPELTQRVANTMTQVLQKSNLDYWRKESSNLRKFVEEQIKVVQQRLQVTEDSLRKFREEANITSLDEETKEILRRITEAENLYNQIKTRRDAAEKKLNLIKQKLAEQKESLGDSTLNSHTPLVNKLKEQLINLEVQYTNLRVQNYPEDHPKIVKLKSDIDKIRSKINITTQEILGGAKAEDVIDPLSQFKSYMEESISLEIEIESSRAQERKLITTIGSYNDRLKGFSSQEGTLFGLLRDRDINNKNYVRLLEEREQARLREAAEIGNMQVIEFAEKPLSPYKPRKKLNMAIAILAGTAIGFLLIILKDSINDVPRTKESIEKILKLPVIASVPKVNDRGLRFSRKSQHGSTLLNNGVSQSFYRDAYTYLWNHLQSTQNGKPRKVIMITSVVPGEGKSTIASNLAITSARLGQRTLIIDGDIRKPSVHEMLKMQLSPGLTNLFEKATEIKLSQQQSLVVEENGIQVPVFNNFIKSVENLSEQEEFVTYANSVLQLSEKERFQVISAGDAKIEPDILWNSPLLKDILTFLNQPFDTVILDMPPLLGIPDALSIASYVDQMVLCVASEQVDKKTLMNTQNLLKQSNCPVTGVVWNKVDPITIYGKSNYRRYYKNYYISEK